MQPKVHLWGFVKITKPLLLFFSYILFRRKPTKTFHALIYFTFYENWRNKKCGTSFTKALLPWWPLRHTFNPRNVTNDRISVLSVFQCLSESFLSFETVTAFTFSSCEQWCGNLCCKSHHRNIKLKAYLKVSTNVDFDTISTTFVCITKLWTYFICSHFRTSLFLTNVVSVGGLNNPNFL